MKSEKIDVLVRTRGTNHILFSLAKRGWRSSFSPLGLSGKVIDNLEKKIGEIPSSKLTFRDFDGAMWILNWNYSPKVKENTNDES